MLNDVKYLSVSGAVCTVVFAEIKDNCSYAELVCEGRFSNGDKCCAFLII